MKKVLEVCAADGRISYALLKYSEIRGDKILWIISDLDEKMILQSRKNIMCIDRRIRCIVEHIVCDCRCLPFRDYCFDLVFGNPPYYPVKGHKWYCELDFHKILYEMIRVSKSIVCFMCSSLYEPKIGVRGYVRRCVFEEVVCRVLGLMKARSPELVMKAR